MASSSTNDPPIAEPKKLRFSNAFCVNVSYTLLHYRPKEIVIGEGTSNGDTWDAYRNNHYLQFQRYRHVHLIDFNHCGGNPIRIVDPLTGQEEALWIAKDAFDFDYIISLPFLKTHYHASSATPQLNF